MSDEQSFSVGVALMILLIGWVAFLLSADPAPAPAAEEGDQPPAAATTETPDPPPPSSASSDPTDEDEASEGDAGDPQLARLTEGTHLHARLSESVSLTTSAIGRPVVAELAEDVTADDGRTVLPAGTRLEGAVRLGRRSVFQFQFTRLEAHGRSHSIEARLAAPILELDLPKHTVEIDNQMGPAAAPGVLEVLPSDLRVTRHSVCVDRAGRDDMCDDRVLIRRLPEDARLRLRLEHDLALRPSEGNENVGQAQ